MGAHDPEEEEDELGLKKNGRRQTEQTNESCAPDRAKPITRQQAHSSSREQADCDKNKQNYDATAATSDTRWPGVAHPRDQPMQQARFSGASPLLSNNKSDAIKSANILENMQAMSGVDAATSSQFLEAAAKKGQKSEEGEFKLPIAKSPTPSSVAATSASNAANNVPPPASNQRRRTPQRKASVFSHDGFPALDELDQQSFQKHSSRSQSVGHVTGSISAEKLANKSQQQATEIQIVAQQQQQQQQQQVMIAGTSKTGELATAKANSLAHSPQRSVRSDTLGSTGSSRASSCDEPTIISPLLKPTSKKKSAEKGLKQSSPTESSTSSLDSIESDTPPASTIHSAYQQGEPKQPCDNGQMLGDQTKNKDSPSGQPNILPEDSQVQMDTDSDTNLLKGRKISNDSSSTHSDDVFESEAGAAGPLKEANKSSIIPPPFESIKNQIKRNSVPDAKTIRQHIDRLISQNEAIMENWNQVSIRSYNSQATSSTTETASTSTSSARTSPKPTAADSTSSFLASAKRPNKQSSSTTALYQGNVFCLRQEQLEQLRLQHSINQQANAKLAAQNLESRRITQDSLDELVGARLRKRSHNNQLSPKKIPARQTSDTGVMSSMMLSPTFVEQPAARNFGQTDQFQAAPHFSFGSATGPNMGPRLELPAPLANPVRQNASNNTSIASRESLGMCFNIDAKHLAERAVEVARQASFNQSIESAIENLSLKRQAGQMQQQQHQQNLLPNNTNLLQQPEDLILATLLAERQRHQQLEDHIFQQQLLHAGKQQEAAIPAALLNYIQLQQQQQQQTLDQQVSLNRLAALEQEYRQQLNDRLLANSMQQQHQQQQQQHQHQANNQNSLIQSVNRLSERQSRESQLLNEFLAKMMLDRDDNHHQQQQQQQQYGSLGPQNHHNGPILKHSDCNDQRPSEMFTQPLDSATPSHRCEACDISFWTRDLLNYHLMTSCSARTGPDPARPLAFNFNQHNGFDQLVSPTSRDQQKTTNSNLLVSPSERFGTTNVKLEAADDTRGLDMTSGNKRQANEVSAEATFQALCAAQQAIQKDFLQSRSASPPRRRTYHRMDAPDQQQLIIPIKHQQHLQVPISSSQLSPRHGQQLVVPKSPTFRLQRLDELQRLKQETLTMPSVEVQESNLPIKKRKISEPNMRY